MCENNDYNFDFNNNNIINYKLPTDEPYMKFRINGNNITILDITKRGYNRYKSVIEFIKKTIINQNFNFIGIFCFHDNFVNNTKLPIFSFCSEYTNNTILLPNYYIMNKSIKIHKDIYNFNNKIPIIFFIGKSTGNYNPELNERIQTAIYAYDKPFCYIKLSSLERNVDFKYKSDILINKQIPINYQLKYKYLLTIDGHGTSFDRFIWQLASNSLVFKLKSDKKEYFYDSLKNGVHYVEVTHLNMKEKYEYYENNPNIAINIINNAHEFIKHFILEYNQLKYTQCIFKLYNKQYNTLQ